MSEICGQCDKEIDPDRESHILIEEHTSTIDEVGEFSEKFFCSWECVKLWVSGK